MPYPRKQINAFFLGGPWHGRVAPVEDRTDILVAESRELPARFHDEPEDPIEPAWISHRYRRETLCDLDGRRVPLFVHHSDGDGPVRKRPTLREFLAGWQQPITVSGRD